MSQEILMERMTWQEIESAYTALPALKRWLVDSGIDPLVRRKPLYDDWNTWWQDQFERYSFLPPKMDRAMEIGCGPYTNIRLIRKASSIRTILCSDPLVGAYSKFKHGWLAKAFAGRSIALIQHPGEYIPIESASLDCVILINVLDHVLDAEKCLLEALRTLKPDGILILGQDLTDQADMRLQENLEDIGHPIRLVQSQLDAILFKQLNPVLFRVLDREQGRAPRYHYATYIFAGIKLPD